MNGLSCSSFQFLGPSPPEVSIPHVCLLSPAEKPQPGVALAVAELVVWEPEEGGKTTGELEQRHFGAIQ